MTDPEILTDAKITELAAFAERLADAAAAVSMGYFRQPIDITNKAGEFAFDPVTRADQEAEAAMRALITATYPDHSIIGEEHGVTENGNLYTSRYSWVLDPIDGTRAFISGLPLWGTLIALHDGIKPIISVMDHPATGERFVGIPGKSWLKDRVLKTRPCASLSDATLSTTDPALLAPGSERDAYDAVAEKTRLIRYGYDCYAYAMVALGFMDIVVEAGLKPYDVQALIPVVEGAGGIVTNWSGGPADQGGQIIAAGDKRVHAEALEILRSASA